MDIILGIAILTAPYFLRPVIKSRTTRIVLGWISLIIATAVWLLSGSFTFAYVFYLIIFPLFLSFEAVHHAGPDLTAPAAENSYSRAVSFSSLGLAIVLNPLIGVCTLVLFTIAGGWTSPSVSRPSPVSTYTYPPLDKKALSKG